MGLVQIERPLWKTVKKAIALAIPVINKEEAYNNGGKYGHHQPAKRDFPGALK